jgi:hypothetical protein
LQLVLIVGAAGLPLLLLKLEVVVMPAAVRKWVQGFQ